MFLDFKHYSVKWFRDCPDLTQTKLNIYDQVLKTDEGEVRNVSRNRFYCNYRYLPLLGSCPACLELKFRLKCDYDYRLFEYFMKCHSINCIDKSIRREVVPSSFQQCGKRRWYKVKHYDSSNFYCLYYNQIPGFSLLPICQVFTGDQIVFNSFQYVSDGYYKDTIVLIEQEDSYYINKLKVKGVKYLEGSIVRDLDVVTFRTRKKTKVSVCFICGFQNMLWRVVCDGIIYKVHQQCVYCHCDDLQRIYKEGKVYKCLCNKNI
jgi:hypothetical protein